MKRAGKSVEPTTGGDAMTPRTLAFALAAAAILVAAPQQVMAQYGGGGFYMGSSDNPVGPTVSPYLNLLQGNNFGVTNYQSLVKPLINQGNAINRQGSSLRNLQQQVNSRPAYGAGGGGISTGHATYFMNYSHYYNFSGR
jgi:hypothetical protein